MLRGAAEKHLGLQAFSGDAGYCGTAVRLVDQALGLTLDIAEKIADGFAGSPKRWGVERTFAWLGAFRKLAKDVEILTATAENMIRVAILRLTLAKCARIFSGQVLKGKRKAGAIHKISTPS